MTSPTTHPTFDVVIIGGGPAGSTAARLLALWGHSVAVLTKPESRQPTLAVSLPPSCRKLFAHLGVLDAVDGAGFLRTHGNTVWWGETERRSESFADGTAGYQVLHGEFDGLLLNLAEAAGARIHREATVREVELDSGEGAEVLVRSESRGERRSFAARWVLDCSGRAGVVARQGLRKTQEGNATLALLGVWRREASWGLPDESHTLAESYEDGWAWSIPISPVVRYFTVMVDPRVTDLAPGKQLERMYHAELAKTVHFQELVASATLESAPWGCDASPHTAHRFSGRHFLLVGDAASCIDPLSSFGVKKAMASAWLAAVVAHTCLTKPKMQRAALDLFETRERQVYSSLRKASTRYFGEAASEHGHPFWTGRAAHDEVIDGVGGAGGAGGAGTEPDIDSLRRDPEVLAALDALRHSPSIRLEPTAHLRMEKKPAILDHEVTLQDHLVAPWVPGGLRFLRDVDLPKLVELASEHTQVPDLFEAYNRACPPVILPDFLGALSVLLAKGMLENAAAGT